MNERIWRATSAACALALLFSILACATKEPSSAVETQVAEQHILLDPGHGGEDGGTVAPDGTLEKNINLAISLQLYTYFRIWGFPVTMTRETDISIHDSSATTTSQKKSSDMKKRLTLYEKADVVLSIHQNHFSVPKYFGTQVFYSGNHPESERLAAAIRSSVLSTLQPDNTRELKKATDGIFLLYRTQRPAVLVECGFLSNPEEREKLTDTAYQKRMAFAIFGGYTEFIQTE